MSGKNWAAAEFVSSFKLGFCQQSSGQSIGAGWKSILAIELQLGLEEKIFFQEEQMAHSQDQVKICACSESLNMQRHWKPPMVALDDRSIFLQMPSVTWSLLCSWKPTFMKGSNVFKADAISFVFGEQCDPHARAFLFFISASLWKSRILLILNILTKRNYLLYNMYLNGVNLNFGLTPIWRMLNILLAALILILRKHFILGSTLSLKLIWLDQHILVLLCF